MAERAFDALKGPIRTVTCPHTPVPFSPVLEDAYVPSIERMVEAARATIERNAPKNARVRR